MAETDQSWIDGLSEVPESYDYDKYYEDNVFDCSNTAQICWRQPGQKGEGGRLMMSYKGHPLDPKMWVVVRTPEGVARFVAVENC